ncbi:ABC transporter substrate-binding protein [Actinomadura macra]|uniref:ABC transporter substrate-binding protein n=1 Tax=Actinomadura macra TaxID=46164 RepID=UPI000834D703|nr:ABC transporter substrate-binding protein [Actinomadura macra]
MRTSSIMACAVWLLLSLTSACGESDELRIVSLSPTATEILYATGAGDEIVAVDNVSDHPSEARAKQDPKLVAINPSFQDVMRHDPDIVIITRIDGQPADQGVIAELRDAKVRVEIERPPKNLDGLYGEIRRLGTIVGRTDRAASLARTLRSQIDAAVASVPKGPERTYFHEIDKGFYTATSTTFIGSVYRLFNLRNIADAYDTKNSGYPKITSRDVIERDPQFVFLADTKCCGQNEKTVRARPGWATMAALRSPGHVVELDDDVASRWGPRVIDFVTRVAAAIRNAK